MIYIILFNLLHILLLNMFKFGDNRVSAGNSFQYEIAEFTNERL